MGNIAYTTDTAFYYSGIISGNMINSLRRNYFLIGYRLSYYTAYFSTGVFRNSNLRVYCLRKIIFIAANSRIRTSEYIVYIMKTIGIFILGVISVNKITEVT